ncbi:MAG: slipin family protein [Clostridia bacterium]|nr:slipin family protein [Clostridia bacterium]
MKKVIINERTIGLLFKNGKFERVLRAGRYIVSKNSIVEEIDIEKPLKSANATLDTLMENKDIKAMYNLHVVDQNQVLIRYIDGRVRDAFTQGVYALYAGLKNEKIEYVDAQNAMIEGLSAETIRQLPYSMYKFHEVSPYEKGILFVDNKLERVLDGGIYYFWSKRETEVRLVDTRAIVINVTGQEILTQDKVSVRVNLVICIRIKDYVKVITELNDYEEHIRICAQLAVREYVNKYKLDEILENKEKISQHVYEKLKEKEKEFYVEVNEAAVRDIILPGEIRSIMNTILLAEKKAQANVITRREEVASTRSLLNTAKLMDENKTLYKLKELEFLEKICENIDSINLNGGTGILGDLRSLISSNKTE